MPGARGARARVGRRGRGRRRATSRTCSPATTSSRASAASAARALLPLRPAAPVRPGRACADAGGPPRLRRGDEPVHQFFDLSSFAEQLLVHENTLVKIRDDMPLDQAALIGCGVTTGVGAVLNTARVRPGETVAVIGCGGIGLNAIQGAAIVGAGRIIAVDRSPSKLELAQTFGATDVVDASAVDPVGAVLELTGGGVDFSFEAIGLTATAQQAFAMLRKGGTATIIGMIPPASASRSTGSDSCSRRRSRARTWARTASASTCRATSSGTWPAAQARRAGVRPMPLDEINDGFAALQAARSHASS